MRRGDFRFGVSAFDFGLRPRLDDGDYGQSICLKKVDP